MKPAPIAILACLAIVSGCAVGPNYHPPHISAPTAWSSPLAGGETNGPVALADWWKNFGDTNLDALMTQAVRSNLDLRIAEARVREARARRAVVVGGWWPSLSGSAAYSRNRWSQNNFPPIPPGVPLDYNLYNAGFDAAWEMDLFGGTRRAVEAANAEVGAAEYSRRDVLVSLLAEVARNYLEARGFQQRLAIARQNIQVQTEILDLTRSRFQHGLSSDLDVQQAAALLNATEAQVPSLKTGFQAAVHHLAVLLGQPPGALLNEMAAEKPIPLTPPVVPVGLPSDLLERRPDIQRAERELAAATARIGVATADLFPKFSLTGVLGVESVSAGNWFDAASRYWTAGPTLQWNIFQAGRLRANIRVQTARQEQALETYQKTVLTALEEAENALVAYAQEQVRRRSLWNSVQADQRALELARQLYRSGLADFLRVLESERSLYAAQDALVQSDQTISLDLVQLYKALGGGWSNPPVSNSK
ncbi:MAG TPA: efflux transporter outer membrane subunit [Verrucomicrobiae bacterium]|nr:efflux transporter outer membrane subunit [Verrucomicrobiae bacterium]